MADLRLEATRPLVIAWVKPVCYQASTQCTHVNIIGEDKRLPYTSNDMGSLEPQYLTNKIRFLFMSHYQSIPDNTIQIPIPTTANYEVKEQSKNITLGGKYT